MNKKLYFPISIIVLLIFAGLAFLVWQKNEKKTKFENMDKAIYQLVKDDKNQDHAYAISSNGEWYFTSVTKDNIPEIHIHSTTKTTPPIILSHPGMDSLSQLSWFGSDMIIGVSLARRRCPKPELVIIQYNNWEWQGPEIYKMEEPIGECYNFTGNQNKGNLLISTYDDSTHRLQMEEIDFSGNTVNSAIFDVEMSEDFQLILEEDFILLSYALDNVSYFQIIRKVNDRFEISQPAMVEGLYGIKIVNSKMKEVFLAEIDQTTQITKKIVFFDLVDGSVKRTFQVNLLTCYNGSHEQGILMYPCSSARDTHFQYWDWGKGEMVEKDVPMDLEYVIGWNDDLDGYVALGKVNNQPKLGLIQIR